VKVFRDFKSKSREIKDCIMKQIEVSRNALESDCFVHIIKYSISNDNLYVVSQLCQQSLREFLEAQFIFVMPQKQKGLFDSNNTRNAVNKTTGRSQLTLFNEQEQLPDLYDLHSNSSHLGSSEEERQHNAHMYLLVSHQAFVSHVH
jgi:hypothetical protein